MKIELTQNIADVIRDKCPLSGACLEVFTGDESENK